MAVLGRFQRVLVLSLFVIHKIPQHWLLAAKVSHINRRKSAVNSLQILQSPTDFTQGKLQSSSNYSFSSLDKSDSRARISARQNDDSLPSRRRRFVFSLLPQIGREGNWREAGRGEGPSFFPASSPASPRLSLASFDFLARAFLDYE